MRYAFLEKMAEEGQIRPEVVAIINKDCETLLEKVAGILDANPEFLMNMGDFQRSILTMLTGGAIATGVGIGISAIADHMVDAQTKAKIDQVKSKVLANPAIPSKDKQKAAARFDEILRYAPGLGVNEAVMNKLVTTKYHTGLTDHDVHSLVNIQVKMTPNPMTYAERSEAHMPKTAEAAIGEWAANLELATKEAGTVGELFKNVAKFMTTNPVGMAATIGGGLAVKGVVDSAMMKSRLEQSFNKAMMMSPTGILAENPDKAREAFETLAHFSPAIATEPHSAHAFMTKIVDYGMRGASMGPQITDIKDLADVEKNLRREGGILSNLKDVFSTTGVSARLGHT